MQDGRTPNLAQSGSQGRMCLNTSAFWGKTDSCASFGGCDIWHLLTYNSWFPNDICDNHGCKDYAHALVRTSVPVIKYHDPKQPGEETLGFILQLVHCSGKLGQELKAGPMRQELRQGSWGALFTGLLNLFPIHPRKMRSGWHRPRWTVSTTVPLPKWLMPSRHKQS